MRPLPILVALLLSACAAAPSASPSPTGSHAGHDAQAERVKVALTDAFDMTFEAAGPHHELGTAPNGVELDLVGVPTEEVVLSVPRDELSLGVGYLPHLRELLHGPARVYEWATDGLACRGDPEAACDSAFAQGNLSARFTDGGSDYLVLVLSRR